MTGATKAMVCVILSVELELEIGFNVHIQSKLL